MKAITWAALPLATVLCLASGVSALAQPGSEEVIVTAPTVSFGEWSGRVSDNISQKMRYPRPLAGREYDEGIVQVGFLCSQSGQPDKVTLLKSSGSDALDRSALQAVRNVRSLHPMADGIEDGQRFAALLMFARDDGRTDRRLKNLRSDAAKLNAWYAGRNTMASRVVLLPAGQP